MKIIISKIGLFFMNLLCMEGSWRWAKKKMRQGYMIRSTEWVGGLKFRCNPVSDIFEIDLATTESQAKWTPAATNLRYNVYATISTYEVYRWQTVNTIYFNNVEVCKN